MDSAAVAAVQLLSDGSPTALLYVHSRRRVVVERQHSSSTLSRRYQDRPVGEGRDTEETLAEIFRGLITKRVDFHPECFQAIQVSLIVLLENILECSPVNFIFSYFHYLKVSTNNCQSPSF